MVGPFTTGTFLGLTRRKKGDKREKENRLEKEITSFWKYLFFEIWIIASTTFPFLLPNMMTNISIKNRNIGLLIELGSGGKRAAIYGPAVQKGLCQKEYTRFSHFSLPGWRYYSTSVGLGCAMYVHAVFLHLHCPLCPLHKTYSWKWYVGCPSDQLDASLWHYLLHYGRFFFLDTFINPEPSLRSCKIWALWKLSFHNFSCFFLHFLAF